MTLIKIPFSHIYGIAHSFHNHMARFGYQSVDTPIIETADLFLTRAGDQVINQLLTFERYGQQLALRPEFTAAAAHYYARQSHNTVERWQFFGAVFADEPDDFSHNYQRLSMGAELIGLTGSVADAEIIGMASQGIQKQGIDNSQLIIGHIGLLRRSLARFHLDSRTERFLINHIPLIKEDKKHVIHRFDQAMAGIPNVQSQNASVPTDLSEANTQQMLDIVLDATQRGMTMGGRTRHDIARRLLQKRHRITQRDQVIAAIDFLAQWGDWRALRPSDTFAEIHNLVEDSEQGILHEWQETLKIIETYGIEPDRITIRPDLSRNWDYYTGIVFEIQTHDGIHLGGGGRYDELVSLVGSNQTVPAVGFACYLDQILAAHTPVTQETGTCPIHIVLDSNNRDAATKLGHILRERNLAAILSPQYEIASDRIQIYATEDGAIRWNQEQYSFQEIEALITELMRAINDQSNHASPAQ